MQTVKMATLVSQSGVKFGTSGARGLVEQMTAEVCYGYTQAFWKSVGVGDTVVLGHDLRPSSPAICQACFAALTDLGLKVVYVGALPTPAVAYFASQLAAPSIIVTGSHIPFDRNGIKFYRADGEIAKSDELAMLQQELELPEAYSLQPLPAVDTRAYTAYLCRYQDFFGQTFLQGKKIAIYQHSSVARDLLVGLFQSLGAETLVLGRTDTFVPIDTEAVRPEDVAQALSWAKQYGFDALVSTDGDADRPLIADEQGRWLRGDVLGILTARFLNARTVVTPVSSNTALEKSQWFPNIKRTCIGSPYVIEAMHDALPVVAGFEANGGFLLGSDVSLDNRMLTALPTRDAVLPMLAVLALAQQQACKLSQLVAELPARVTYSDRIQNFATDDSQQLLADLLRDPQLIPAILADDAGAVVDIDITDGLRVTFESSEIVHLRPSGNAPELRCYVEATTAERATSLCQVCLQKVSAKNL